MRNRLVFIILSFIGIFTVGHTAEEAMINFSDILSPEVNGWRVAREDRLYDRKNLYDYIDGGAELYFSYGFQQLFTRIYSRPEQPDIIVDIFHMGSSPNAYGIFSHSRETEDTLFGQGSQYTAGLLMFWKDCYFVSLLASPETGESRKALFEIARQIEAAIPRTGPLPEILDFLPKSFLLPETIRYFHHHLWLNSYYFLADSNILSINENTPAVLAKYGGEYDPSILLLVHYPDSALSYRAYENFIRHFLPERKDKRAVQLEDGRWCAVLRKNQLLILVLNSPAEKTALKLIEAVEAP
ncbi:MAG: hypothetical protein Kow0042_31570 [Calditrichia bacterium]